MGCTLIPTEVFKRIPRPWFEYANDASGFPVISEDVPFCQKAIAAGCPIWTDATIKLGHVGNQIVTEAWAERGQIERRAMQALRAEQDLPGMPIHNIELHRGRGGQICRSAVMSAQIMAQWTTITSK